MKLQIILSRGFYDGKFESYIIDSNDTNEPIYISDEVQLINLDKTDTKIGQNINLESFLLSVLFKGYWRTKLNFKSDNYQEINSLPNNKIHDCIEIGSFGEHTGYYLLKTHKIILVAAEFRYFSLQERSLMDLFHPYIDIDKLIYEQPNIISEFIEPIQNELKQRFKHIGTEYKFFD